VNKPVPPAHALFLVLVVSRTKCKLSTRDRINGFAMGIIKDGQRFDPRLLVKQDYDFYLMSLFWKRFIWRDDRYCFEAKHYTNKGGLYTHRSCSKEVECIKILQHKYGKRVVGMVKNIKLTVALPAKA